MILCYKSMLKLEQLITRCLLSLLGSDTVSKIIYIFDLRPLQGSRDELLS